MSENEVVPETPPEEKLKELTTEEKVEFLAGNHQALFLLVRALGEVLDVRLCNRIIPGGKIQFYWEKGRRIVVPGGPN